MAANLRVLRRRIKSTKNIAQITKAMEMVAASRISKAQARVEASRPYADEFTHVLQTAARAGASDHPLLTPREEPKRVGIVVVTSDRGLCGGYNANVLRETERLVRRVSDEGKESVLFVIGGKGTAYFRFRNREMAGQFTGFSEVPDYANAAHAADHLTAAFLAGGEDEVSVEWDDDEHADSGADRKTMFRAPKESEGIPGIDEIHVVFTQFRSMLTQSAISLQVAPLDLESDEESSEDEGRSSSADSGEGAEREAEYAFEPEPEVLFDSLLPKYVRARVFAALLDAAASESAARQRAMKAATDNANDLVDNLVRESNQARQAQITQEISEIVGGSDALAQ
ncbi:F0F1 ATP synthase subunit gamma [Actinomycetospora termitidis]|uniref:ATP synthase gamma chain n=1 Tax=Actinomycetospora termitidis TaxID=3053470 RepID=A0ABT7M8T5_9PSEU|nr:F0F1 ATP synthase subunit gamma [Actinomycetospora sp. Odt1-22]MDL5157080.1 F0F1 ATP synthase subunit gamma [Actinomycetospora sp. Odt1-22]